MSAPTELGTECTNCKRPDPPGGLAFVTFSLSGVFVDVIADATMCKLCAETLGIKMRAILGHATGLIFRKMQALGDA